MGFEILEQFIINHDGYTEIQTVETIRGIGPFGPEMQVKFPNGMWLVFSLELPEREIYPYTFVALTDDVGRILVRKEFRSWTHTTDWDIEKVIKTR